MLHQAKVIPMKWSFPCAEFLVTASFKVTLPVYSIFVVDRPWRPARAMSSFFSHLPVSLLPFPPNIPTFSLPNAFDSVIHVLERSRNSPRPRRTIQREDGEIRGRAKVSLERDYPTGPSHIGILNASYLSWSFDILVNLFAFYLVLFTNTWSAGVSGTAIAFIAARYSEDAGQAN